jgi:hypothetical protein
VTRSLSRSEPSHGCPYPWTSARGAVCRGSPLKPSIALDFEFVSLAVCAMSDPHVRSREQNRLHAPSPRLLPRCLIAGGRVALALLGFLGIAIGGSLVAYVKFAHARPLVALSGSLASIVILMEPAYRRWDRVDQEAAERTWGPVEVSRSGAVCAIVATRGGAHRCRHAAASPVPGCRGLRGCRFARAAGIR